MLLKGKKAVITGGTSGIGKAIALLFAENGADVAIFGIDEQRSAEAVSDIKAAQSLAEQKALFQLVDVSSFSAVEKAMDELLTKWGNIDIFVNNAGITKDNLLMKMKEEDWDAVLSVNLKSVYNTCHALIRHMLKAKSGKIINIASVIGLMGNAAQANYAASKAGVIAFSKSLAKEVASRNITVNCIAPGFIKTQMTDVLPEKVKEEYEKLIPMQKMGLPLDIAKAALFLASHLSDYITGQVITVDGGMVM
jgi:3-oxoacyl-[acyl-carrier protein] reductase